MQYCGFTLDRFQEEAIRHLEAGDSVLVSAPTGTGKTVIADWIVDQALATGKQVVYTAPVKALSNQKYRDYCRLHGEENVGLVTGDLVIRRDAPCLVMTTEILRNMLLGDDAPTHLLAVVLDEIHFLDDWERGTVWEEVLLYLPSAVQVVGLSATLSNLREFAAWLEDVHKAPVTVVTETERAVPLELLYATREGGLQEPDVFAEWHKRRQRQQQPARDGRSRGRSRRGRPEPRRPRRQRSTSHLDVYDLASEADLLPYLYFVFSRKSTESFARGLARKVTTLLDADETERLDAALHDAAPELGAALDPELRQLYRKGIAFHHAGLHVQLKTLVEGLYEQKLVKVLYCTTTFALGINMPARAAVLDALVKYDGRGVNPLTTREFMQMAGRAGRRGMDKIGHVLVRLDVEGFDEVKASLQRYRANEPEPVRSRFNLSWNSVVNLLDRHDEDHIRQLVERSFLNWHLTQKAKHSIARAKSLEGNQGRGASRRNKEARRLRRRAAHSGKRCWVEFEAKVGYLQAIGYLDEERGFNAGAQVLMHLQIAEIATTELVLSGLLEDLAPADLFGVLCGIGSNFPRSARLNGRPNGQERRRSREIEAVVASDLVVGAAELSHTPVGWSGEMSHLGRLWASGTPLQELLLAIESPTDISGDLITSFRRAKDLAGQLKDVYRSDTAKVQELAQIIRTVSRDEVEVVG